MTIYEALSLSYIASQKENEALPHLEKAASLESKNKDIYYLLGNSRFKQTNYKGAIDAYDKAISLGANDEVIYNNRGKAKLNAGMLKESIADFDRSIGHKE